MGLYDGMCFSAGNKLMAEFHRTDMALIDGERCAMFTMAEGTVFYNMWSQKGKWVGIPDLLKNIKGEPVPSENPAVLIHNHIFRIRRKIEEAEIDLVIENQRQSFWADAAYRIKED